MIQVIKHGYLPKYEAFCSKCGCDFIYHDKDICCKTICDKYLEIINCPECGQPVDVKERMEILNE